jgi:hypothetical protein
MSQMKGLGVAAKKIWPQAAMNEAAFVQFRLICWRLGSFLSSNDGPSKRYVAKTDSLPVAAIPWGLLKTKSSL